VGQFKAGLDIQPFVRMLQDFVNALREGKNPPLDGRERKKSSGTD